MTRSVPPSSSRTHASVQAWPFMGRDSELQDLAAIFGSPRCAAAAVIMGEPGIGKTRLAEQFVASRTRSWQVRRFFAAPTLRAIPLGVFGQFAAKLGSDPFVRVRAVVARLEATPTGRRPLIWIDDVQFLDDTSAYVVLNLIKRGSVAVLMTARTGVDCPESVSALWSTHGAARIDVGPSSRADVCGAIETRLGGSLETGARQRFWEMTRGNCLYMQELAEGERRAGRLHLDGLVWVWHHRPELSPNLRDLVEQRIGRVGEPLLSVIDFLSVCEPVPVEVMTQLVSAEALERAESAGLVSIDDLGPRPMVRLGHPLFGDVRRASAGTLRLARMREQLIVGLADGSPDPRLTLQRARLALDAQTEPDPRLMLAGAKAAMQTIDLDLANRLANAAKPADGAPYEDKIDYATTLLVLGRGAEVERMLAGIQSAGLTLDDAYLTALRIINDVSYSPDRALAKQLLDDAAVRYGEGLSPQLCAARAVVRTTEGRYRGALVDTRIALEAKELPAQLHTAALSASTLAAGYVGDVEEMEKASTRAFEMARTEPTLALMRFYIGIVTCSSYRMAGLPDRADELTDRLREESALVPPGVVDVASDVMSGYRAFCRGNLRETIRLISAVLAQPTAFARTEIRHLMPWALFALIEARARSGDHATARKTLDGFQSVLPRGLAGLHAHLAITEAWVLAAESRIHEAIKLALETARGASSRGDHANEVMALQTATQLGDTTTGRRLLELASLVDGPRAGIAAQHAKALTWRSPSDLETASAAYLQIGDQGAAADAAAQASAHYRAAGDLKRAQWSAALAKQIAEECSARTTAVKACDAPDLTNREREIIGLVAAGQTYSQIAGQLGISARTVEGHVRQARQKVGAASRQELVALVARSEG